MKTKWMFQLALMMIMIFVTLSIFAPVFADQTSTTADHKASISSEKDNIIKKALPSVFKNKETENIWSFTLNKMIWSLFLFLLALYSIRALTKLLETIAERMGNYRLTLMRVIPIIRIGCWSGTVYFIVGAILAPPIATLMALAASAGIALGFASQDILKNIFGGVMILMDRPFQVGDKIRIRDHYGEVLQIGLRSVKIETPDDSVVTVPNSDVMNQAVINANSGESNCQVVADFYLPTTSDIRMLKTIATQAAEVSKYIYLSKPIAVVFKNEIQHGQSVLKMRIKAYVLDIRHEFAFESELTELVLESLKSQTLQTKENT